MRTAESRKHLGLDPHAQFVASHLSGSDRRFVCGQNQGKATTVISPKTPPESDPTTIDRNAPAGTPSSLGAESVRDGRPSTDDSVVEAMDEEAPPLVGS